MPGKPKIIAAGTRFGKLITTGRYYSNKSKYYYDCICDCGTAVTVRADCLTRGVTKSCGCLHRTRLRTHGRSRTPEHNSWMHMQARGWLGEGGFERFLAHVGPRPSAKHSIDRYPNNNGNYEPGNVRWATQSEQATNTRRNRKLTFRGQTLCVSEWERLLGFKRATIHQRLHKLGWTVEQALTTPSQFQPAASTPPRLNVEPKY